MGVDDRGDAVNEFKAKGDEQGEAQQEIGPCAGDRDVIQITCHVERYVAKAACQGDEEGDDSCSA